jgi:hypothetical protein
MIRLLFVVFVTLVGFVTAALWGGRPGDVGIEAVVEPEVVLGSGVAPAPEESALVEPAPAEVVSEEVMPAEVEGSVEVEDLVPRGAFTRDDAPVPGEANAARAQETEGNWAVAAGPRAAEAVAREDLDGSAHLIRRMLAVYRAAEERR